MASPHVGAVGLPIEAAIVDDDGEAIDLSDATVKVIRIKKPGASAVEKAATLVGDVGNLLRYVTVAGDLDVEGKYEYQARVVTPGWADHSSVDSFEVLRPL